MDIMLRAIKLLKIRTMKLFVRNTSDDTSSQLQIPEPNQKITKISVRKVSDSSSPLETLNSQSKLKKQSVRNTSSLAQTQLQIPYQLLWKASNLADLKIPKHEYRCNKISPYYPYAREETHKWENKVYKMADQKAFVRQDFPMFAALAYPRAVNEKKLLIASKFASIAFAMDTDLELMITNDDIPEICNYAKSALNVLKGEQYDRKYPTLIAFDQLFREFGSDATEYQYKSMNWAYQQFIKADHVLSINYNIPKRVIPLNRYFEFSRPNSCSNLLTTLIDYELGFCLQQKYQIDFLNNANTIALINNCNDYLALSNDIISLPKEYLNFEVKNYVICHSLEYGCDLQQSMEETLSLLYEKVNTINGLVDKIMESNVIPKEDLSLWMEAFFDVMYGVAQWYQFTDRYSIDNINYNASQIMKQRIDEIRDNNGKQIKFDTSNDYDELYENLSEDWSYFRIDK